MKIALQPAYVLHSRPFRDSSVLLEVFTAEHGRVSLVARGLGRKRRGGSLASLLQPFQPLLVGFQGRGELQSLRDVEAAGHLLRLRGDALISGFYLNELLLRLVHRSDPQPTLFLLYGETLELLGSAETSAIEPILRRFEFRTLEQLGYAMDLRHDAHTGVPLVTTERYIFTPEHGVSRASGGADAELTFPGADLLAVAGGRYESAPTSAKRLARLLLQPYLGDKPLRSKSMFRDMRALQRRGESPVESRVPVEPASRRGS